ncbi:uncharacterized protein LOC142802761 isoform X2 [Rhipicephalus microplus]|uniref:uncharacterized protein LOC142802761 isoform X2 n=1 Tax=Rhipicephalus microplus TaxID=6941 RepID=UPI002376618A
MFSESSWQMPCTGLIVFVYGVANFLAFVGETTYSLATIAETPEADNYQEYFRAVTNGTVRVITMLMCSWWIISANKPENLMTLLGTTSMFSHTTRLASATTWLLGEAFVLSRMHAFYCAATAPDYWKTNLKEQTLAVHKKPAVVQSE